MKRESNVRQEKDIWGAGQIEQWDVELVWRRTFASSISKLGRHCIDVSTTKILFCFSSSYTWKAGEREDIWDDKNVIKLDTVWKLPEKCTTTVSRLPVFFCCSVYAEFYAIMLSMLLCIASRARSRKYPSEAAEGGKKGRKAQRRRRRRRMKTFITHVKWRNDCQAKGSTSSKKMTIWVENYSALNRIWH